MTIAQPFMAGFNVNLMKSPARDGRRWWVEHLSSRTGLWKIAGDRIPAINGWAIFRVDRRQRMAVRKDRRSRRAGKTARPKSVWDGRFGGAHASRVQFRRRARNSVGQISLTGFRRDAENGNRDGRAPHYGLVALSAIPNSQFEMVRASFPVFILRWTIGAIGMECDGITSLSLDATCRVGPKRGHVRALQSRTPCRVEATRRVVTQ